MSLASKLTELKTTLTDLLAFANNKTKKDDVSIGDAIKTLCDGYGGGSGDVPFAFGGMNATLVSEYSEDYTLDDTSFVKGKDNSTSATTILASVTNKYTNTTGSPTYNYRDKDIVVVQSVNVEVEHEASATNKALQLKSCYVGLSFFSKRKTTDTSEKTTRQNLPMNVNLVKYYNASGVVSRALAGAYGFYGTPQTVTVANGSADSTYVRVSSPALACRASSSYESSANMLLVKDVKWHWNVKVYAVDSMSSPASAINDLQDEWLTD